LKKLLPAAALVLAGCAKPPARNDISCAATIFPVYSVMKAVGGDRVSAFLLVPPGSDAHEYEPRPQDVVRMASSRIFACAGNVMEPWAGKFAAAVGGSEMTFADLSAGVKFINSGAGPDPHYWLDLGNAAVMAQNAAAVLERAAPQNRDYYRENLSRFRSRLSELDAEYKTALSSCKYRTIIYAGHASFGYLAARYGLGYYALGGSEPGAEPPAARMSALAAAAKGAGMKAVFYEELSAAAPARTIAKEAGADIIPLNPLHEITPAQYAGGADYLSLMEGNLKNLAQGLECK